MSSLLRVQNDVVKQAEKDDITNEAMIVALYIVIDDMLKVSEHQDYILV